MNLQQLVILLPCHSFEDFPQHHRGDDAAGLLAGWTALWHPSLLAAANRAPVWYRADDPPQQLEGKLIVVPAVSERSVAADLPERAAQQNAVYITTAGDRPAILARALQAVDSTSILEGDLVQDFLALGYAFLQIQLLTRQMRYSSSLDEVNFNQHLLAAAKAAVGGDESEARNRLSTCFSLLAEERDHFYAVDAFLLDLTLLTPDLLGTPVQRELQSVAPVNLLLSGQLLEEISSSHPETLQALQAAVAAQRVGFAGGEHRELRLPLLSCESILAELLAGLRVFESQLGRRVDVYGRRRFGMTPLLPLILARLGFRGTATPRWTAGVSRMERRARPVGKAPTVSRWMRWSNRRWTPASRKRFYRSARSWASPWIWTTSRRSALPIGRGRAAPGMKTSAAVPVTVPPWDASTPSSLTFATRTYPVTWTGSIPTNTAPPTCVRQWRLSRPIRFPPR